MAQVSGGWLTGTHFAEASRTSNCTRSPHLCTRKKTDNGEHERRRDTTERRRRKSHPKPQKKGNPRTQQRRRGTKSTYRRWLRLKKYGGLPVLGLLPSSSPNGRPPVLGLVARGRVPARQSGLVLCFLSSGFGLCFVASHRCGDIAKDVRFATPLIPVNVSCVGCSQRTPCSSQSA